MDSQLEVTSVHPDLITALTVLYNTFKDHGEIERATKVADVLIELVTADE